MVQKGRQYELDILRIVAMFFVMLTHVCSSEIHDLPVTSSDFVILNTWGAAVTWDVPVFVMISGRFFLDSDREISIPKIFGKYIRRLLVAFAFWSAAMTCIYIYRDFLSTGKIFSNWRWYLVSLVTGPYHLWFVFMIVGLYMATPLLRKIVEDKGLTRYFIILAILFETLIKYGVLLPFVGSAISDILYDLHFDIVLGYTGYFMLGYYLYRYQDEISIKLEKIIYVLGAICVVFACIATAVHSVLDGEPNEFFSTYQTPNVTMTAAAVYLFTIKRVGKYPFSTKGKRIIEKLAANSMGMYFCHAVVIEFICGKGRMLPTMGTALVMPFIITVIVFAVSFAVVEVFAKIPLLRKVVG